MYTYRLPLDEDLRNIPESDRLLIFLSVAVSTEQKHGWSRQEGNLGVRGSAARFWHKAWKFARRFPGIRLAHWR